jgi:hypothetical protein
VSLGPPGRAEPYGDDEPMVEQHARLPLRTSVLSRGSVVLEGRAAGVLEDEAGRKVYRG